MRTETVMGAAMERAGFDREEAALMTAFARWRNNGGTLARLIELGRVAYGMPGEGQAASAEDGQGPSADARLLHGEAGQPLGAREGHPPLASASPHLGDGPGHAIGADEGQVAIARPSPSEAGRVLRSVQLNPSTAQILAMGQARLAAAKVILKIDGEDIRSLTIGRCRSLLTRSRTENYVLSVIVGRLKHLPDDTVVGKVLNDGELESIAAQGKEFGHVAA